MRATNETRKPTATPNGKTAGETATKNTATRIDRWNKLAEERIARLAESPKLPGLAMLQTCAEIEGMTPVDLIVERLKACRYGGKTVENNPADYSDPDYTAKRNAYIDTDYERNMSTRARNNHEREVVTFMIWDFAQGTWIPQDLVERYGVCFVRNYYHKGDTGLFAAFHRMTADALERCAAGRMA